METRKSGRWGIKLKEDKKALERKAIRKYNFLQIMWVLMIAES